MSERGRPSIYTPEIAATICERLAAGETLRSVCRDEGMPSEAAVRAWALDDVGADVAGVGGFSAQYTRARELGYLAMADETVEIADYGTNDTYLDNEGNKRTDYDVIARSKLRVETRKWLLSKALPKVYGDKVETTTKHQLVDENAKPVPLEMARRIAFALAQATADPGASAPTPIQH